MVDHMLARCEWAVRLGAEDIAEARGVERALHGADVRLQAHHVYQVALNRSRRKSSRPTTGVAAVNYLQARQASIAAPAYASNCSVAVQQNNCVIKDVLKLFAAMQCATFGTARGQWSTCAHSRPTSSPRWCMHTSAHTLRKLQSSLSSM